MILHTQLHTPGLDISVSTIGKSVLPVFHEESYAQIFFDVMFITFDWVKWSKYYDITDCFVLNNIENWYLLFNINFIILCD